LVLVGKNSSSMMEKIIKIFAYSFVGDGSS
jgi:hypothetical protein